MYIVAYLSEEKKKTMYIWGLVRYIFINVIINKIYTQSIICKFNRNLLQVLFKYIKKNHIISHITSGQYTRNSYTECALQKQT